MKTIYTITEIRKCVLNLCTNSMAQARKNIETEVIAKIDSNAELSLDVNNYKSAMASITNLHKKYNTDKNRWLSVSCSDLSSVIINSEVVRRKDEIDKIKQQFNTILSRLNEIKSPAQALDFLLLCGIELPSKIQTVVDIPVDPDFIKSILPQNKMLT